jgi:hypothetical protein
MSNKNSEFSPLQPCFQRVSGLTAEMTAGYS